MPRRTLKERQANANWPICKIEGCEKPVDLLSQQLCNPHSQKWRKYGDPLAGYTYVRHGESRKGQWSKEYLAWTNMRHRCSYKNDRKWKWYGGRGITVCLRWQNSFTAFLADMGRAPRGHSLDRIDPDGNYEPGNCRWADQKTQSNNRGHVVLTDKDVLEIRRRHNDGETPKEIAKNYRCSVANIRMVINRKAWKDT